MAWRIDFDPGAIEKLAKLDRTVQARIASFLDDRLSKHLDPRKLGQPLQGNYKGLWRYRVGDYRILCKIKDEVMTVLVVHAGHRKEVYKK